MPAVSKKQQRFFGYLLSNPEERKKKGISKKAAKDFAQDVKEVAPPGWGHTKAEKEKTKPDKPKSKIGGSAAAFDRARKEGRFKGSKADMFKLMWWMKNKGGKPKGKPHYKPGTDKKYKKYQEDWKPEIEVIDTKKRKKEAEKRRKEASDSLPPHLKLDVMKKAFAQEDFKRFMDQAQAARDRVKKRQEERKKKDAQFVDTREKGIKFYDKKGSGRIVKGKKVYN